MFQCDLEKKDLRTFQGRGAFKSVLSFEGVGFEVQRQIYQCVEDEKSEKQKDSVGGGTTTYKTYTYKMDWVSEHVNSNTFKKRNSDNFRNNCGNGAVNPDFPPSAPKEEVLYAAKALAGPYTLQKNFVRKIPITAPLEATSAPAGWIDLGAGE